MHWTRYALILFVLLSIVTFVVKEESNKDTLEVFKEDYMVGCMGGGDVDYEYCDCSFEYLDSNHTNEEILNMALEVSEDENAMPVPLMDAAMACIDHL